LAARSSFDPAESVLYGKKTTALTKQMELIAWRLTRLYLGYYYRTYQIRETRIALPRIRGHDRPDPIGRPAASISNFHSPPLRIGSG
jgi:hypothetical protein